MNDELLKRKAQILHNRLRRDLQKDGAISLSKCNGYVNEFESLKESLYDAGHDWVDDCSEIDALEEDFISGEVTDDEIQDKLEEIEEQLERALTEFGVDTTKSEQAASSHLSASTYSPVTIINAPVMSQHAEANANVNVNLEIKQLEREFEQESKKILPNRTKMESIIEKIKTYGPVAVPVVAKLIEKLRHLFPFNL